MESRTLYWDRAQILMLQMLKYAICIRIHSCIITNYDMLIITNPGNNTYTNAPN